MEKETPNDYNDRSIRAACCWYIKHLPNEHFILITDDNDNRSKAIQENIISCTSKLKMINTILIHF